MPAAAPKRLGFARSQRLKRGGDFARTRLEGERMAQGCLIANWRFLPPDATTRLGVLTSRKIGSAVVRNRARRLLREAFRVHQAELTQPTDLVLVARRSIVNRGWADVEKDFLAAMSRAGLLKETQ